MRKLILLLTLMAFIFTTVAPTMSLAATTATKNPNAPVGKGPAKPAAKKATTTAAKKVKKKKKRRRRSHTHYIRSGIAVFRRR